MSKVNEHQACCNANVFSALSAHRLIPSLYTFEPFLDFSGNYYSWGKLYRKLHKECSAAVLTPNTYQQKLWFTRSVNYLYQKLLILHISRVHFLLISSLVFDAHTDYYKQLWSEQSDKCRYSCIKYSSQLGGVSTGPLFLSATAMISISGNCKQSLQVQILQVFSLGEMTRL